MPHFAERQDPNRVDPFSEVVFGFGVDPVSGSPGPLAQDKGKLIIASPGATLSVFLPPPVGVFGRGFYFYLKNLGPGSVQLTPLGGATVNGKTILQVFQNDGAIILSDGANWQTLNILDFSASGIVTFPNTYALATPIPSTAGSLLLGAGFPRKRETVLSLLTSTATPTQLQDNRITLEKRGSLAFTALVTAKGFTTGNVDSRSWEVKGAVTRELTTASLAFVGTPSIVSLGNTAGAAAWAVQVNILAASNQVRILGVGQAGVNIVWAAAVNMIEIKAP
jgi:hypothetical protein